MFKKVIIYEKNTEPPKDYIWVRGENLDETVEWNGTEWAKADATVVLPGAKGEGGQPSNINPNTVFETDDCVAIKLKNGHVVSGEQYTAGGYTISDVQGIACRSTDLNMGICVGLTNAATNITFGYTNTEFTWGIDKLSDAYKDFNGQEETNKLLAVDSTSNFAAVKASEFVFPDGTQGWLPSCGEMVLFCENKSAFDAIITLLATGDTLEYTYFWSSTPTYELTSADSLRAWSFSTYLKCAIVTSATAVPGTARPVCQL